MRILTGKDKKAFNRLESIASDYVYFLRQLQKMRDDDSSKITFVCTENFIKSKLSQIKLTLDGTYDIYSQK